MNANSPEHPHEPPEGVEHPSTLRITSTPFAEHHADTVERVERWEDGSDIPHVINFEDASRLQRVLTPRRLELVESLMTEPAESIRDLSDRLDRDVRQVHDDLQLLHDYRIVHFRDVGRAKQPYVPYVTVTIEVTLDKPVEDPSESAANA